MNQEAETPTDPSDNDRLRILLVDDESLILYHLSDLIEDLGHIPVCASSGAHALSLLSSEPRIDLVITDQSMPEMNGTELAVAARAFSPELPIVLSSGYGETVRDDGIELPSLPKPYTIADLEKVIATVAAPNRIG